MLDNPEDTFGKLARFLYMQPTEDQLKTAIHRVSFRHLQEQEAAHGFREKPDRAKQFFREGRAGQWRDQLSRSQARKIMQAHRDQMAKFNYPTK